MHLFYPYRLVSFELLGYLKHRFGYHVLVGIIEGSSVYEFFKTMIYHLCSKSAHRYWFRKIFNNFLVFFDILTL
jgi:hypothetical protein